MTKRKRLGVIASVIVVCAAVAGFAYAQIPSSNGVITACYVKNGGGLRVIDASTSNCTSKETRLDWNQTGPQGIQGGTGLKGDTGAVGPTEGVNSVDSESFVVSPSSFNFADTYRDYRASLPDPGPGINGYPFTDDFQSNFTTTKTGKLFLTQRVFVSLNCGGGLAWGWILLDGQAVPGSLTRLSTGNDDAPATVLTGVTDGSASAGSHTLDFGAKCANGAIPTGALHDFYSTGTAVVLG